ncbi:unnamed protein product [Heterosigma akashiwo]
MKLNLHVRVRHFKVEIAKILFGQHGAHENASRFEVIYCDRRLRPDESLLKVVEQTPNTHKVNWPAPYVGIFWVSPVPAS